MEPYIGKRTMGMRPVLGSIEKEVNLGFGEFPKRPVKKKDEFGETGRNGFNEPEPAEEVGGKSYITIGRDQGGGGSGSRKA